MQRGGEVGGKLVDVGFGVGEGEVKFCAHWIKEHSSAEQFKHHGSATVAVGGEPVAMTLHRAIKKCRLRQRSVAEHMSYIARLVKRLAKALPQQPPHRMQPVINARLTEYIDRHQSRRKNLLRSIQ